MLLNVKQELWITCQHFKLNDMLKDNLWILAPNFVTISGFKSTSIVPYATPIA